jgi:hypothetical protein
MVAVREAVPVGRYGRASDQQADRTLKIVGGVLGAVLLVLVGWFGYSYIAGQKVNGQVTAFKVVSDDAVQVSLEVTKGKDATGVCTLQAVAQDHSEVGRMNVTFDQRSGDVVRVVTIRTTARATTAQLVSCTSGSGH